MNDGPLAEMLAELDAELASRENPWPAAEQVLEHLDAGSPGAIERHNARRQLQRIGSTLQPASW
jgi:hypothetical protein